MNRRTRAQRLDRLRVVVGFAERRAAHGLASARARHNAGRVRLGQLSTYLEEKTSSAIALDGNVASVGARRLEADFDDTLRKAIAGATYELQRLDDDVKCDATVWREANSKLSAVTALHESALFESQRSEMAAADRAILELQVVRVLADRAV